MACTRSSAGRSSWKQRPNSGPTGGLPGTRPPAASRTTLRTRSGLSAARHRTTPFPNAWPIAWTGCSAIDSMTPATSDASACRSKPSRGPVLPSIPRRLTPNARNPSAARRSPRVTKSVAPRPNEGTITTGTPVPHWCTWSLTSPSPSVTCTVSMVDSPAIALLPGGAILAGEYRSLLWRTHPPSWTVGRPSFSP